MLVAHERPSEGQSCESWEGRGLGMSEADSQRPVPELGLLELVEAYDEKLESWQTGTGWGSRGWCALPVAAPMGGLLIRFMRA